MIISNDESSHETIWSILKDSISTSQLVLGLYLTFYLFWPTKTRKSPTSKGCNLRRDPQHATGPTCWYRKTVAHDVRKSKESPHPVLSCDEKNYVIYIYIYIYKDFQNKCLKLSSYTPIQVKLRMSHYHLSLHHVARKKSSPNDILICHLWVPGNLHLVQGDPRRSTAAPSAWHVGKNGVKTEIIQ